MTDPQSWSNSREEAVTVTPTLSLATDGQWFQQLAQEPGAGGTPSTVSSAHPPDPGSSFTVYQDFSNPGLHCPVMMGYECKAPLSLSELALRQCVQPRPPPPEAQGFVFGTSGQQLRTSGVIEFSSRDQILDVLSAVAEAVIGNFGTQGRHHVPYVTASEDILSPPVQVTPSPSSQLGFTPQPPVGGELVRSGAHSNENMAVSVASTFPVSPFGESVLPTLPLPRQPENSVAITYVNKIKKRFESEPEKYKQFLDILHAYQKQQRRKDRDTPRRLTEYEVYNQVAVLFENQDDLLHEFLQYLPGAMLPKMPSASTVPVSVPAGCSEQNNPTVKDIQRRKVRSKKQDPINLQTLAPAPPTPPTATKRSPTKNPSSAPPPAKKKTKYTAPSQKSVSLAEDSKYGTAEDFEFFEKVRAHLRSKEAYQNFVRALQLFNLEVFSRSEILQMLSPFLFRAPELLSWFKRFLEYSGRKASQQYEQTLTVSEHGDKLSEEHVVEIDFSICKRLDVTYRALPKGLMAPISSGRTLLCKEVLNEVCVSCPAWSEGSTFVSSRKAHGPLQDVVNRCEDERFELDVVIESNAYTIVCFEVIMKTMAGMTPKELSDFELDDCLGGTSSTINQRSVRRLYAEGQNGRDIIEGLKKNPNMAVPIVLRRLKAKDEEWRDARQGFSKLWEERIERHYQKRLDLQKSSFLKET